ncbi:hypothetical protein BC938DRAFT_481578 [Jimgerdemannia flammicorona]|uniref:UBA domain-containing protein n=1 Tax=Jimgerdemannia flammicorona TaxID=994334 RepID=A0A433QFS3_9FUNG|nr:hypothetical protein BC938DRAFT_481578 [Jimgerdemannia flammicorona]
MPEHIYSAIEDVPIIASPQYRIPKQVSLPYDFSVIPDDVSHILKYDFKIERYVLSEIAHQRQQLAEQAKLQAEQQRSYEEAKRQKEKQKARKIAPGFLDTDRRILTPEPVIHSPRKLEWSTLEGENDSGKADGDSDKNTSPKENGLQGMGLHSRSGSEELGDRRKKEDRMYGPDGIKPSSSNSTKTGKSSGQFNFLEFEQGLPPPDPWDAGGSVKDDLAALRDVLGGGAGGADTAPSSASSSPSLGVVRTRNLPTYHQSAVPGQPQVFPKNYIPVNSNNSHAAGTSPSPISRNALQASVSTPLSTSPRQYVISDNSLHNQPPPVPYMPHIGTPPPPPPPQQQQQLKYAPRPLSPSRSTSPIPPARPPKAYYSPNSSPALTSAALPIFTKPGEPVQYRTPGTAPPLPPLPSSKDVQPGDTEQLADLMNMGFTRQQAVDALEKNDYDLAKATNFLLDWGMV